MSWWYGGWIDLGRSLKDLIELVSTLDHQGVGLQSLQESIDTTSSSGKLIFHMFGALAEFERNLIRERTHAGLTAARARGRKGGRPKALDPRDAAWWSSSITSANTRLMRSAK